MGGCLRSPLVDYVNVTVNRGDAPTQQAKGPMELATYPHQGFSVSGPPTLLSGGSESHR